MYNVRVNRVQSARNVCKNVWLEDCVFKSLTRLLILKQLQLAEMDLYGFPTH